MSTYLEMQNEVLNYGFDATVYRARVKTWLNDAQGDVARKINVPELFTTQTLAITVAAQSYALSTNIIRIDSATLTDTQLNRWTLLPTGYKEVILSSNAGATGLPQYYGIDSSNIIFSPWPDTSYTASINYYKLPPDLVNDSDVSILTPDYHNVLISYAVGEAYLAEDDSQMFQLHNQRYGAWIREMGTDRQHEINDGPTRISGTWGPYS